jgi:Fe-Mn family superoxide dismutase
MITTTYEVQDILMPRGLEDISDEQIQDHWTLYKGYVTQTNQLNAQLVELTQQGKVDSLEFADRRRRYGFEYNGMVLHEYYFGTGMLTNHFIGDHQNGNVAGFAPILVLDVWEHAYMVDHRSGGRGKYIAAFMKNVDWEKVEMRYSDVMAGKISKRF